MDHTRLLLFTTVWNHKKFITATPPPRFVFDQRDAFLKNAPLFPRPTMDLYLKRSKALYLASLASMDIIIANSKNVRQRIRKYLGVDAEVIHPPVDTDAFQWKGQEDYYLSPARLDTLKRVNLIVQAFMTMPDRKLLVDSGGPEMKKIMRMADGYSNIQVLGPVSEQAMKKLVGNCVATVYVPENEDFGISPVESMSAGKPVIGVAQGGLLETVIHEETGLLILPAADPQDIAAAVRACTPETALSMRSACISRSHQFSRNNFLENFTYRVKREI